MTAEPDLLPCPFCGSENIDPKGWASTYSAGPACDDCGACAGGVRGTLQDNIAAWNRRAQAAEIEALRAEVERANGWNKRVYVCRDHVADIVDGPCVICALDAAEARADKLRAEVATWEGLHASEVQVRQRWQARAERLAKERREFAKPEMAIGLYTEDRND